MTPDILEYLLRLTVIWAALLAYYFVALRRSGFAVQRFYLLGTLAFGLVVPLLPALGGGLPVAGLPSVTYVAEPFFYTGGAEVETTSSSWSWFTVLPWLYFTGVVFFAARTLVQWKGLWHWASSGKTDRYDGYRVIRHEDIGGPFVAFGYIFLPAEMTDADLEYTALIHEASHLRARHHYDTLLLTIGSLLLWFHPLFWMLRRLLATVHEYEADAAVIQRVPVRTYGLQLLQSSLGPAGFPGLFSSPIKHRIDMITNNSKRRSRRFLPLFMLVLLLGGLTFTCSDLGERIAAPAEEIVQEIIEGPVKNSLTDTDRSGGFYADTEDLDASMNAYLKDIYQEIRYPASARTTGTSGKFRAKLRLGTDGKIETMNIGKFTDDLAGGPPAFPEIVIVGHLPEETNEAKVPELLVDEVDRVLNETDKFQPMLKGGAPARQSMNIDFMFKLEDASGGPVAPLKKKTLTEGLNSNESYQKGYNDAKKAIEKVIDGFTKSVYEKITYPASARAAGETGKFDFSINIDERGRVGNVKQIEEYVGENPITEITLVGVGEANATKIGDSDILVEEIIRTLTPLQLPEPFLVGDSPMPIDLLIRFNFKLEE